MAPIKRIAMTLDIQDGKIDEYYQAHQAVPKEVQEALRSVGIRNLSLWYWGSRMFYYAEYVSDEPFDQAMARYAKMPGVKEWEERMHKFQKKLPGASAADDVWWQPCTEITHQD